jgi:hypothetical protein
MLGTFDGVSAPSKEWTCRIQVAKQAPFKKGFCDPSHGLGRFVRL